MAVSTVIDQQIEKISTNNLFFDCESFIEIGVCVSIPFDANREWIYKLYTR